MSRSLLLLVSSSALFIGCGSRSFLIGEFGEEEGLVSLSCQADPSACQLTLPPSPGEPGTGAGGRVDQPAVPVPSPPTMDPNEPTPAPVTAEQGLITDFANPNGLRPDLPQCPVPEWSHWTSDFIEPMEPDLVVDGSFSAARIECVSSGGPLHAHCNTNGEEAWARLSVSLGDPARDPPECFDLSGYSGLEFIFASKGTSDEFKVMLHTFDDEGLDNGVYESKELRWFDSEWHLVDLDYSEFESAGDPAIGPEVPFSASRISRISFSMTERPLLPYNFWIDDVAFFE